MHTAGNFKILLVSFSKIYSCHNTVILLDKLERRAISAMIRNNVMVSPFVEILFRP